MTYPNKTQACAQCAETLVLGKVEKTGLMNSGWTLNDSQDREWEAYCDHSSVYWAQTATDAPAGSVYATWGYEGQDPCTIPISVMDEQGEHVTDRYVDDLPCPGPVTLATYEKAMVAFLGTVDVEHPPSDRDVLAALLPTWEKHGSDELSQNRPWTYLSVKCYTHQGSKRVTVSVVSSNPNASPDITPFATWNTVGEAAEVLVGLERGRPPTSVTTADPHRSTTIQRTT